MLEGTLVEDEPTQEPIEVEPIPDSEELVVVPDATPEPERASTASPAPPAVSSRPGKRPEFGTSEFGRQKDWFLSYDDKNRVWTSIAADMGTAWQKLSREEKEQAVANYTEQVIDEVIAMAGGIWGGLSLEQKRELFHARFIDKTVPAAQRQARFEGTEKKEEFLEMDNWFLKNRKLMEGMTLAERTALYKVAKAKWEKANKK